MKNNHNLNQTNKLTVSILLIINLLFVFLKVMNNINIHYINNYTNKLIKAC